MSINGVITRLQPKCAAMEAAVDRFAASPVRRFLFAALFGLFLFALGCLTNKYYGPNDDWTMGVLLSGHYDVGGNCLFIGSTLAHLVYWLNTHIVGLNWFLIAERFMALVAFVLFVYIALGSTRLGAAAIGLCFIEFFLFSGVSHASNFSYVSGLVTAAGWLTLLATFRGDKVPAWAQVTAVLLCVFGLEWRYEVFFISLPFIGLTALIIFVDIWTSGFALEGKEWVRRLLPTVVALVLCGCAYAYTTAQWELDGWQDWREYNHWRSNISDFLMPEYDEAEDQLQALGVSKNDYVLADSWVTADPEYFTSEKLEDIVSVGHGTLRTPLDTAKWFASTLLIHDRTFFLGILAVTIGGLLMANGKRGRRMVFGLIGMMALVAIVLVFIGRFPNRVEHTVWLFVVIGIMLASREGGRTTSEKEAKAQARAMVVSGASGVVWVLATLFVVAHLVPAFNPAKIDTFVMSDEPVMEKASLQFASDPDVIRIWDVKAYTRIEQGFEYRYIPSKDFLESNQFLGGWTINSPMSNSSLENIGIDNTIKSLVEDDRTVLVTHNPDIADGVLLHLQEHYYPNATMQVVDEVNIGNDKAYWVSVYDYSAND